MRVHFGRQRGFSLIEAIVALGVLSVGGYFLMTLVKTGSVGQKTLLAQDDARVITDDMAMLLSDPTACANTFGNKDVVTDTGSSITAIKDKNGADRYSIGQKYGNRGLQLGSLNIGGTGLDSKTRLVLWSPSATGMGTAFVRVGWAQTGAPGNSQGPQNLFRFFLVQVTAMNGNRVVACTAMPGGGGTNYWSMNSNGDIYNNNANGTGNVGIGTSSPAANLDINGTARLRVNEAQPFSCDVAHDGALALNKTHQLCVCNGGPGRWVLPHDGSTVCSFTAGSCVQEGAVCSPSSPCCVGLTCNAAGFCVAPGYSLHPLSCTTPGLSTSPDCPALGWADAYGASCNQQGVKCRLSGGRCAICQ